MKEEIKNDKTYRADPPGGTVGVDGIDDTADPTTLSMHLLTNTLVSVDRSFLKYGGI